MKRAAAVLGLVALVGVFPASTAVVYIPACGFVSSMWTKTAWWAVRASGRICAMLESAVAVTEWRDSCVERAYQACPSDGGGGRSLRGLVPRGFRII